MKKYLTLAIAISGITIGFFYLHVNNQPADEKTATHTPTEELTTENHHTPKAIASAHTEIPSAIAGIPAINSAPDIENKIINEKKLIQDSAPESLNKFVMSFPSEIAMAIYFQEEFNNEELDYEWVNNAETSIASTFYEDINLQTFSPGQVQCKTRLCQVPMNLENDESNTTLMKILGEKFKTKSIDFAYAIITKHTPEKRQYLYFIRKHES